MIAATGLQFIFGVAVVRFVTQQEYGLISLSYLATNVLVTFAGFGFITSVPRFLANRASRESVPLGVVAGTVLAFSLSVSCMLALLLYFFSSKLAAVFGKPDLAPTLRVFSLLIPPLSLIGILTALFRGAETSKPKVLFQDVGLNVSRLLVLLLVIALNGGFNGVLAAYVISGWLAAAAYLVYAYKRFFTAHRPKVHWPTAWRLISFSFPLLGVALLASIMGWAGTLSVGYFHSAREVALFTAPMRLAGFIPIALTAVAFLYLPIASRLIGTQRVQDVAALYCSTTKWAFMATLPLLLYLLLFAHTLVVSLFGPRYGAAGSVLQVLALGQMIHTLLGPNGMTVVAYGGTRPLFVGSIVAAAAAVSLSLALVPGYGALGAACAVAVANALANGYISLTLLHRYGVHPFRAEYVKPLLIVPPVGYTAGYLVLHWLGQDYWVQAMLVVLLIMFCLLAPLLLHPPTEEDIELLSALERKLFSRVRLANWLKGRRVAPAAVSREDNL